MAREKKMIHKVQMTDGKKALIHQLLQEYDIETAEAHDEKAALKQLEEVHKKWSPQYPNSMKRWFDNWDVISPIFKFSVDVRTAFYTTNSIESLN